MSLKLAADPLRRSSHATIAPPAPSARIAGAAWVNVPLETTTPFGVHNADPNWLTRCAYTS